MSGTKLLRGYYSVYAFYPEAQANWATPNGASLQTAITNGLGFDISCALDDSAVAISLTASAVDNAISICDIGNVSNPTFFNYSVSFDSFRNGPASVGSPVAVYETPVNLFSSPDDTYYIMTRIGPAQGTALATGQIVNIYGVNTDYPQDILKDGSDVLFGSRFKANGNVYTNATLA